MLASRRVRKRGRHVFGGDERQAVEAGPEPRQPFRQQFDGRLRQGFPREREAEASSLPWAMSEVAVPRSPHYPRPKNRDKARKIVAGAADRGLYSGLVK